MLDHFSGNQNPGRPIGDVEGRNGSFARDNWFTVASLPFIPPARLSEYDMRYDQGLARLVYLQTLIDEELEG
jgi:hypothetical protein